MEEGNPRDLSAGDAPEAFLRLYEEDRAAGRVRPLPEYQALFPGRFREVARAWRFLRERYGGDAAPTVPAGASTPLPGARIGPFRLEEEVGRGGQAVVYRAEDTRLGRRVALKVLPAVFAGGGPELERLRREARVAARLDHPGIAAVHEAGEADGVAYIAMRFVEGETLARRIEDLRERCLPAGGGDTPADLLRGTEAEGPAHVAAAVALVEKAARALQAAHEAGLVHRDIKPGNLMITPSGDPVLLDFGLAREEEEGVTVTRTGALVGTPAYLAPELVASGHHRPDARSDVYALGVVLHEALTLRLPFEAPTRARLFHLLLTAEPEDPRAWNRAISRDLSVVIRTALARDPDRRYLSAADLAGDLRRLADGEPIRARPPGPLRLLGRWIRRRPAVAAASLTLGLSLAGGLAVSLHLLDRARSEGRAKDAALEEARLSGKRAARALTETRALALAGASSEAEARDPTLALLLAREAARVHPGRETLQRLRDAIRACRERAIRRGHGDEVDGLALHPGTGKVVSCSRDNTARLWDEGGRCLAVLDGDGHDVVSAAFAPGGDPVATGSAAGTVALWSGEGARRVAVDGHTGIVETLEFSPDGTLLLSSSRDGTARLWNREGGAVAVLEGHGDGLHAATFSPDGARVLTASRDGTARLWSREGRPLATLAGHGGEVRTAAFSAAGDRVLTASSDGTARLWSPEGSPLLEIRPGDGPLHLALFAPDGGSLLTVSRGGTCRLWSREGVERAVLLSGPTLQRHAAFSPAGDRIAVAGEDGIVRLWDGEGTPLGDLRGHEGRVNRALFTDGGRRLLTSGRDATVRLFEVETGEAAVFRVPGARITSAALDPAGDGVLLASSDGVVRLQDLQGTAGEVLLEGLGDAARAHFLAGGARILAGRPGGPWWILGRGGGSALPLGGGRRFEAVAVAPAGDRVVALDAEGDAVLFDGSGAERARLGAEGRALGEVSWSPEGGRWMVRSGADRVLVLDREGAPAGDPVPLPADSLWTGWTGNGEGLWAIRDREEGARFLDLSGRVLLSLPWHNTFLRRVAFEPRGARFVAAGEGEDRVSLRDLGGGEVAVLRGHGSTVRCAAFSPDGRVLATGSYDATVRLWTREGTGVAVLSGHRGSVVEIGFASSGDRILSRGSGGTARLWVLDPGDLVALADARAPRGLAPSERLRYADLLGEDRPHLEAAQALAASLLRREWLLSSVEEALAREERASSELREWALRFAREEAREGAQVLNDRAWPHVVVAGARGEDIRRALAAARRARDLEPRDLSIRNTLAVALYRSGLLEDSLVLLEECEAEFTDAGKPGEPGNTAFLAMALHRLGRGGEAREALARLRRQMEVPGLEEWWSNRVVLEEAVSVVEGVGGGK